MKTQLSFPRVGRLRYLLGTFVLLFACFGAQSARAVICQTSAGATSYQESIGGTVSVPDTVPDGTIIWISPTRTTVGVCKKPFNDQATLALTEPISFYALTGSSMALYPGDPTSWGIEFGIRYQGNDYWLSSMTSTSGVPTGFVLPRCVLSDYNAGKCYINVSITYQVLIRKRGLSPYVHPGQDAYSLFQFDGVGGVSAIQRGFQYVLTGLNNIVGTSCTVDVTVTPEPGIVDFGQVQAVSNGFSPPNPTKPFSLALDKRCSSAIRISGYFDTGSMVQNNLILPSQNSNFGISIRGSDGQQLPIREPFALANFSAAQSHIDVPMSATLVPLGNPQIGPFSSTVTIQVLYN